MRIREVRQKTQTEVNIKAGDGDRGAEDGDRSDLATIMVSDGGLANPAFPSHDGIAPCGPSVSYRVILKLILIVSLIVLLIVILIVFLIVILTLIMILMEISYLEKCLLLLNS